MAVFHKPVVLVRGVRTRTSAGYVSVIACIGKRSAQFFSAYVCVCVCRTYIFEAWYRGISSVRNTQRSVVAVRFSRSERGTGECPRKIDCLSRWRN